MHGWPLPAVVVAHHITYDGHPDSYPLHIASKVLSDGDSSRIYRKLVYEKQLALAAFGGGNIIEQPNLFFAVAIVQPGQKPEDAVNALIAELDRLRTEPISADELQQAKNQFARDYILGRESNKDKAMTLGHAVVIHNDIKTADGEFDIFMNTTATDVQRVAQTYFRPENRLVLTIMPRGAGPEADDEPPIEGAGVRDARADRGGAKRDVSGAGLAVGQPPRPLPAREIKFPPYAMRTLANGLQVIAVSHHEQPAVSVRLLIRAGGAQDPDQAGLGRAGGGALLDQGTATRSAEQIAHTIDSIGGVLGRLRRPSTFITSIVMKDSLSLGLDLVSDVARNAAFQPQEVELQRKQMLSGLTVSYDDPEYLAGVVFDRLIYESIRMAGRTPARQNRLPRSRETISSRFTRHGSARTTPFWRSWAMSRATKPSAAPSARSVAGASRPGPPRRPWIHPRRHDALSSSIVRAQSRPRFELATPRCRESILTIWHSISR